MRERYASLTFIEAKSPIDSLVTKFGGQPVWFHSPEWPLDPISNEPMLFIGQVALRQDLFPGSMGKMAYLFFNETNELLDLSEKGVIVVQPGRYSGVVRAINSGPAMTVERRRFLAGGSSTRSIEYKIQETLLERDFGVVETIKNKIGGSPDWLLVPDVSETDSRLFVQLVADRPLQINMGDGGIGYGFIDRSGTVGKFVIQST